MRCWLFGRRSRAGRGCASINRWITDTHRSASRAMPSRRVPATATTSRVWTHHLLSRRVILGLWIPSHIAIRVHAFAIALHTIHRQEHPGHRVIIPLCRVSLLVEVWPSLPNIQVVSVVAPLPDERHSTQVPKAS